MEGSLGEWRRPGHITKQGNFLLRFLLVEAPQVTVPATRNVAVTSSAWLVSKMIGRRFDDDRIAG